MNERRPYHALDLSGVRRHSIWRSSRKVSITDLARVTEPAPAVLGFLESLPGVLAGRELREFLREVAIRHADGQPLLLMFGGHVVKCGLAPLLIDLIERDYVTALAMNGSGAIHDVEMTLFQRTSEDVAAGIGDGTFGMVSETADFFHEALRQGRSEGYGEAVGRRLLEMDEGYASRSLLAAAYRRRRPATVHVAIGTDTIHQHPSMPAAEVGDATYRDFRILCAVLSGMDRGGVVINVGSAVILPEVFLKALTVVRNLGHRTKDLITADFDMLQHYRPRVNVVERPTLAGGRGFRFVGHHEILIPILHAGLRCYSEIESNC